MNIHLKIESKKNFNPLTLDTKSLGITKREFVKSFYKNFLMINRHDYGFIKMSKKAKNNFNL